MEETTNKTGFYLQFFALGNPSFSLRQVDWMRETEASEHSCVVIVESKILGTFRLLNVSMYSKNNNLIVSYKQNNLVVQS